MIWSDNLEQEERRPIALWLGLAGAALALVLGMFAPHDAAWWRMPAALKQRVAESLSAAGYPGIDVEMRGQQAVLRGIVEDETQIAAIERAAMTSAGAGGPWAGGVTAVDATGLTVGSFERPFAWSIRRAGDRVVLSGAVPSEYAREELLAAATQAFPNATPINQMRVAGGAPSPLFADLALTAVRSLARLRYGEVRIIDGQITFVGEGSYTEVEALRHAFASPPAPFHARLDVLADGLDLAHPELQGVNLATGGAPACAQAFVRLTERNPIRFIDDTASVDPASRALLDSIASVAMHCDGHAIEIMGPGEGGEALSRARAQAIITHLVAQGVSPARLSAEAGAGPGVVFDVTD
ncbi:OmpA family protein [Terricaulis sp.]|uniref:OmpA family protein n=1 Tax=Terricaulis sp. TaxID=2768686 RepID=UPI00378429F0